jgi:hypothetical protein
MAYKWETYYSKHFLPWDSGVPSSQLVAFLTSCLRDCLPAIGSSSSSSRGKPQTIEELVAQAEAAPIALPPEPTAASLDQALQLHTCEHCAAFKPPAAGRVLELGCGTGASAVWLAKQVNCARISSAPAAAPCPADKGFVAIAMQNMSRLAVPSLRDAAAAQQPAKQSQCDSRCSEPTGTFPAATNCNKRVPCLCRATTSLQWISCNLH